MLEFICLFFPPVLGVALIERLLNKKYSYKTFFILYVWLCLSSNFIIFLLKRFWFQTSAAPFSNISVDAAFNYIPLAILTSALIAFFTTVFLKKTELRLELKKKEKEENAEIPEKKEAENSDH